MQSANYQDSNNPAIGCLLFYCTQCGTPFQFLQRQIAVLLLIIFCVIYLLYAGQIGLIIYIWNISNTLKTHPMGGTDSKRYGKRLMKISFTLLGNCLCIFASCINRNVCTHFCAESGSNAENKLEQLIIKFCYLCCNSVTRLLNYINNNSMRIKLKVKTHMS